MYKLYQKLYDADSSSEMEDFLVRQYAIMGMCKSVAVLAMETEVWEVFFHSLLVFVSKYIVWKPVVTYLTKVIKTSLFENSKISEQIAALNGILYLIEGKQTKVVSFDSIGKWFYTPNLGTSKVITSILSQLFNMIITNVSATSTTLRVRLHLLAVLFLLIEQYPKESEVSYILYRLLGGSSNISYERFKISLDKP